MVKTWNGGWNDEVFEERKAELIKAVKDAGMSEKLTDKWEVYRYNPPWTIPAFKKNEVAFEMT